MRFFNTTGPVRPKDHYSIPPLDRLDLDSVLRLIRQQKYLCVARASANGQDVCPLGIARLVER